MRVVGKSRQLVGHETSKLTTQKRHTIGDAYTCLPHFLRLNEDLRIGGLRSEVGMRRLALETPTPIIHGDSAKRLSPTAFGLPFTANG